MGRSDLVGKPFVLHYANGWGYWVSRINASREAPLTNVHGSADAALSEFAQIVTAVTDAECQARSGRQDLEEG